MRLCVCVVCVFVCVCVCQRGISESIGCDGGGCSVSLSCCDAEAGSRSEITDGLAGGEFPVCCFFNSAPYPPHRW